MSRSFISRQLLRQWNRPVRGILARPCLLPRPAIGVRRANYSSVVSAAELRFGQPLHETHPHLLMPGELTPGISALEYAHRRSKLASKLPKGAVAVVAAADVKWKSGSVFYPYHQDSDFFYLTGFNEPGAVAVIANDGSDNNHTFNLYVRPKDPHAEMWSGARSGVQAAIDVFNADESGNVEQLSQKPPSIITDASTIFTDIKTAETVQSPLARYLSSTSGSGLLNGLLSGQKTRPLKPIINDLRMYKSDSEILNMRIAGQASGRGFTDSMRHGWTKEKDLESFLEYRFKVHGCDTWAFVPVVAAGNNALCIHYVQNDNLINDNKFICVDAGGEFGNYITDITRTWPANGKFSDAQRDLYTAVLNTQRTCVSLCRETAGFSLDKLHNIAEKSLADQLRQLGFDSSGDAISALFPHHLGHYIGLDVHDCPGYPRAYRLMKGQCITIEPGIYVPDDERWPKAFRGMGIRIEDSVCVGDDEPLILSTEAVKEIDDIEALRS